MGQLPPFALTPAHRLFNLHTIPIIDSRLVVLSFGYLRPRNIHLLFFDMCYLAPPKQANQPWHHQARPRLLRLGPLEAAAPCVVGAAVLPMEVEGKATGRKGSGGSCWLLCVLVFFVVVASGLLATLPMIPTL
jgi:hypothetical protein